MPLKQIEPASPKVQLRWLWQARVLPQADQRLVLVSKPGSLTTFKPNFSFLTTGAHLNWFQVKMPPTNGNQFHDWSHTGGGAKDPLLMSLMQSKRREKQTLLISLIQMSRKTKSQNFPILILFATKYLSHFKQRQIEKQLCYLPREVLHNLILLDDICYNTFVNLNSNKDK